MPEFGHMKQGMEFRFDYLSNSKFIISFAVTSDDSIPQSASVLEDELWKFSDGSFEPVQDIHTVDALAYQYVKKYHASLGGDKEKWFQGDGWNIYSYYINERKIYRCSLESNRGKICLIIDEKTGKPLYFWEC